MLARSGWLHDFLQSVASPERQQLDGSRIAVVVAHPDDETIGCGALLTRLAGVQVVVVTDGAPRNLQDAQWHGFQTAKEYASARVRELLQAMRVAGVASEQITQFGIPDQEAALNLRQISDRLRSFFAEQHTQIVITHAYEGGHPDHDAVAFCVDQAARRVHFTVGVIEVPLYRASETGDARQSFAPAEGAAPVVVELTADERGRKQAMIAAHATQEQVLALFDVDAEQFRIAPGYDFARPPNGGRVLYDRENWGIRSQEWLSHVRAAQAEERALCG